MAITPSQIGGLNVDKAGQSFLNLIAGSRGSLDSDLHGAPFLATPFITTVTVSTTTAIHGQATVTAPASAVITSIATIPGYATVSAPATALDTSTTAIQGQATVTAPASVVIASLATIHGYATVSAPATALDTSTTAIQGQATVNAPLLSTSPTTAAIHGQATVNARGTATALSSASLAARATVNFVIIAALPTTTTIQGQATFDALSGFTRQIISHSRFLAARRKFLSRVGRNMALVRNTEQLSIRGFFSNYNPTETSSGVAQTDGRVTMLDDEIVAQDWAPPRLGDTLKIGDRNYRVTASTPVKDGSELIGHDLRVRGQ